MPGYVYRIFHDDNIIYVGSTNKMEHRIAQHKHRLTHTNDACHNLKLYTYMREHGLDFDNIEIKSNIVSEESRKSTEDLLITILKPIGNTKRAMLSEFERDPSIYRKNHKAENKVYQKQYRFDNSLVLKDYARQRYEENKPEILEKNRQWRVVNKDKISEHIKTQTQCDHCNKTVQKGGMSRHKRSIYCQNFQKI